MEDLSLTDKIDSNNYIEFVKQVTSPASSDLETLIVRMRELDGDGVKLPHLLTGAIGASSELGEAIEIIKKCLFQGKPYTNETKLLLQKELGDSIFYLAQFCIALGVNFEDIMHMNYEKLSARYPEGAFSVYRSENRKEGDVWVND